LYFLKFGILKSFIDTGFYQKTSVFWSFSTASTPDAAAAITEITTKEFKAGGSDEEGVIIEYKYKINDKKGPLELMGKSLAMFTDKKLIGEDKDNPLTSLMNKIAQEAKAEGPLRGESES